MKKYNWAIVSMVTMFFVFMGYIVYGFLAVEYEDKVVEVFCPPEIYLLNNEDNTGYLVIKKATRTILGPPEFILNTRSKNRWRHICRTAVKTLPLIYISKDDCYVEYPVK